MKNTTFESIGGTYKMTNDCLIPELSIAETAPLGKWGLLRKHYLMDNHKALYSSWMLTGELDKHLAQVEQEAQKRFDQIVVQLSVQRGITEKLRNGFGGIHLYAGREKRETKGNQAAV